VFVNHNNDDANFAIMGVQNELSFTGGTSHAAAMAFLTTFYDPFLAIFSWAVTKAYLPDVMLSNTEQESDDLKETAYHEFSHASHYRQVGKDFWKDLVEAEIRSNGWGDANGEFAPLIALCESWPSHMGHTYANRTYQGLRATHALNVGNRTWINFLEQRVNFRPGHVPIGLYHDMIDNINAIDIGIGIIDNVNGFTQQQIFSCLTSDIRDVEAFRQCIIDNHLFSSGNNITELNNLFNSY